MKKLYYLIILTVILGLVLTGCFLSNVGQVPTTEQSGISSLTKNTVADPSTPDLIAGGGSPASEIVVGQVLVWNDEDYLYVKYSITDLEWCLTETHVHVGEDEGLGDFPLAGKQGNPVPGKFEHSDPHGCVEYTYKISLDDWTVGDELYIAAHAVVENINEESEETAWADGERFTEQGNWATYFTYDVQEILQGILTGTWLLDVNEGSYMHDMFIVTQDPSGALTGTGGYPLTGPPYDPGFDWELSGQLTGNSVTLNITYTGGYTTKLTGTVAPDWNSMGGSGTSSVTTWVATRLPQNLVNRSNPI